MTGLGSPDVWNLARDIIPQLSGPAHLHAHTRRRCTHRHAHADGYERTDFHADGNFHIDAHPEFDAYSNADLWRGRDRKRWIRTGYGTVGADRGRRTSHRLDAKSAHRSRQRTFLRVPVVQCHDQTVAVPVTFTKAMLGYWFYSDTGRTGGTCLDNFYSRLRTTTGATVMSLQHACNTTATNDWVYVTFDLTSRLSALRGRSLQIYYLATTRTGPATDFYIDDASLTFS